MFFLRSALWIVLRIVHHTVILKLSKELHTKQSIQRHEEQEKERHIVNLLARTPEKEKQLRYVGDN